MKKYISLLFVLPLLLGCNKKPQTFKLRIERSNKEEMTQVLPEFMYEHAITNAITSIYYVGDDKCEPCKKLKPQLDGWCKVYHGVIYYIPISSISDETQLNYLKSATHYEASTPYSWEDNPTTPAVFFMMDKCIVNRTDQESTMSFLLNYVEVNDN